MDLNRDLLGSSSNLSFKNIFQVPAKILQELYNFLTPLVNLMDFHREFKNPCWTWRILTGPCKDPSWLTQIWIEKVTVSCFRRRIYLIFQDILILEHHPEFALKKRALTDSKPMEKYSYMYMYSCRHLKTWKKLKHNWPTVSTEYCCRHKIWRFAILLFFLPWAVHVKGSDWSSMPNVNKAP